MVEKLFNSIKLETLIVIQLMHWKKGKNSGFNNILAVDTFLQRKCNGFFFKKKVSNRNFIFQFREKILIVKLCINFLWSGN